MKLTRWHIATHIALAVIAMLVGFIVSQYQALAEWRAAANACTRSAEAQSDLIRMLLR